ncbi:MAG: hypothetical protein ACRDOT_00575 [Aeromicrobium sp.]
MTETTHAETLGIAEGSIIWVIADSVEETALLDPLPAGAETVDEPIDGMDAALLLADNLASLEVRLDEVLPSLGSTPVAWISFPSGHPRGLDRDALVPLVGEYGWGVGPEVRLDETWSAVRLRQL